MRELQAHSTGRIVQSFVVAYIEGDRDGISYHIYASCFCPPFCGASYFCPAKCFFILTSLC